MRQYDPTILAEPRTYAARFTPTGHLRLGKDTGRVSFQCARSLLGSDITIWTIGPLGWWHDFQSVPGDTSFDDAVRLTYIPRFYGWED